MTEPKLTPPPAAPTVGLNCGGPYGIDAHWKRFFVVLLAVMALSHLWTLMLFLCVREHFTRYFTHDLTFSIIHSTAFACAVALLSTVFDGEFFSRFLPSNNFFRSLLALVMLALFVIVTWAVWDDGTMRDIEPSCLKKEVVVDPVTHAPILHPETRKPMLVTDYDAWLHEKFAKLPPVPPTVGEIGQVEWNKQMDKYRIELSVYENALSPYKPYVKPFVPDFRWERLNLVAYTSFILTWFFSEFLVVYVGSVFVLGYLYFRLGNLGRQAGKEKRQEGSMSLIVPSSQTAQVTANLYEQEKEYYFCLWNHYIIIFILIVWWFPLCAVATYYQNAFLLKTNWIAEYAIYFILILVAFVFLAVLLLLRYGRDFLGWLALLQVVVPSVFAVVAYFNEKVRVSFSQVLERILNSNFIFFVIIYLVLWILAVAVSMLGPRVGKGGRSGMPI